jgi:3-hydroxyisobutyrate dehydrogenase-like beta-hydroxyacid dehydrogenase
MTDVAVLGLGRMGGAIARALLAEGRTVTVWNRSPAAVDPLTELGAQPAATPAEAIASSPIAVVVVLDYDASYEVLGTPDASAAVRGRTIVQLTSGTPAEARAMDGWANERSAGYVDGYPMCFENVIGTPDAILLHAGASEAVEAARPHLEVLGQAVFAGADPGSSKAILTVGGSLLETCYDLGVAPELPSAFKRYFDTAMQRGLAGQDITAMLPLFLASPDASAPAGGQ